MFRINNQLYDRISFTIQNQPINMNAVNKKDEDKNKCDGCMATCNSTLVWHHK